MAVLNTDPLIGQTLDGYRVETLLGRGGMARVYRALDVGLGRPVAIKVIDPLAQDAEEYRRRFRNEAKAIAGLEHPNIVRIYRFGEANSLYYMAMDYLDGGDMRLALHAYHSRGELMPHSEVLRLIRQIASALDYAYSQGIIHRDIKPSNILLNRQANAVLSDFGLALRTSEGTKGEVFGSPRYIAPEQAISSKQVTRQTDLYALGVILFEMLTGHVPYDDGSDLQIVMAHMSDPLPEPQTFNPELHRAFNPVLETALAKRPEDRYGSGKKMAAALRDAIQEADTRPPSNATRKALQSQGLRLSNTTVIEKVAQLIAEREAGEAQTSTAVQATAYQSKPQRTGLPRWLPVAVALMVLIGGGAALLAASPGLSLPGFSPSVEAAPLAFEGPVTALNGANVTVFDLVFRLPDGHPLLTQLREGSRVRIEGMYIDEGTVTRITSISAATIDGQPVPLGE